ncbi:unnamed protein product [Ilex paraguariensis]|uniref:ELYS-like domain-containing protein n=1 Tax=Ilex paraguariensis TaxID=185542 RepID=A0ABC8UVH4_9AQUA
MERRKFDRAFVASDSSTRPSPSPLQPNYTCRKVQKALEHLATIDLLDLCNEAKVEQCRATRDLRSCGRCVQNVLNSCGHASLCDECSQRCDICPICRIPMPKNGNRLRLRLYNECIEAGLISKRCDDRFQEKDDGEKHISADVQRLYSLFDVALENNLVSLICHYVRDVCMDETAVSSDPVVAFLLDEVVVKDWCKQTFQNTITELQWIYNLTVQEMKELSSALLKFSAKLTGISNVLEVLESSFKGSLFAHLHDLHHLHESILKTKQHMEMIIWCTRHQFLEHVKPRHTDFTSWYSLFRKRKSAAIKRAWPDSAGQDVSLLFIEEALSNLDIAEGYPHEIVDKLEISSLQRNGGSSFFQSKIEGMAGCYPFENLQAATDLLFLHGNSDLVVAKQAIFLYYLFDRHWQLPDEKWRYVVDDFAATFSITRRSLLESFTFYLLDDHTDEALQEACRLLPEISGPTTHPKVAQVLLERKNPDAALMVLRWSGRDGGAQLVSLGEAVTAVWVRVECGLLTEAFTYQRMLCTKVKEQKLRNQSARNASDELKDECLSWTKWVEVLVTEICCLCIRRNLLDRMIELPWNSNEEKHLHKCLLDFAMEDPSTTIGSLLVVFYLQRFQYVEAYQVDCKLKCVEQDISNNYVSEEVLSRIRSASHWRTKLVDRSVELLPEVQRQQLKTGKLPEVCSSPANAVDFPRVEPVLTSLLVPSSFESSFANHADNTIPPLKPSVLEIPSKLSGSVNVSHFELGNYGSPSIRRANVFNDAENGLNSQGCFNKNFRFDNISSSAIRRVSPMAAIPLKELNRRSSRVPQNNRNLHEDNEVPSEKEHNVFIQQFPSTSPYPRRIAANPIKSPYSKQGVLNDSSQDSYLKVAGNHISPDRVDKPWNVAPLDDLMDVSWR